MNKRFLRNPATYIAVAILILLGFSYAYYQQSTHKVVTFQGTVTNEACENTGGVGGGLECTLHVEGNAITYQLTDAVSAENGVIPAAYYQRSMVGKKVEVHAARVSYHKYTLDGAPGYYVKLVQ